MNRIEQLTEEPPESPRGGRFNLRWMICVDLSAVLEIEQGSFDVPWTEDDFLKCLRTRNCVGTVAEHGGRVVGYMIYELCRDHLTLINFAVAPDCRRCGVGRALLRKLTGKLASHRRTHATAVLSERNLAAQLFFQECGWRAVRVAPAHYGPGHAGYGMEYRL